VGGIMAGSTAPARDLLLWLGGVTTVAISGLLYWLMW
jgi:hypothetical protein